MPTIHRTTDRLADYPTFRIVRRTDGGADLIVDGKPVRMMQGFSADYKGAGLFVLTVTQLARPEGEEVSPC